jgi:hypothetical protein
VRFRDRVRGKLSLTVNFKSLDGLSVRYAILSTEKYLR